MVMLRSILFSQDHDLADTKFAHADHRAVDAGAILVHSNDSFHYCRISLGSVWVKVHHDTALIAQRNLEASPAVSFTKQHCSAHPPVFLKWLSARCFDHKVWSKSAHIHISA